MRPAPEPLPHVGARLDPSWRATAPAAWLAGWQPESFDLGGGLTGIVTLGRGEPMLLLPPLPGWKEAWIACAARLAADHRVIACDLRAMPDPREGWGALERDVLRLADAFAPDGAVVVGHSLGGALALRHALAHPRRVRALVLSSAFARVLTPLGQIAKRWLEQPLVLAAMRLLPARAARPLARRLAARSAWVYDPHCDEAVLEFVRHGIRSVAPRHAAACVRLALAHDVRAHLGRLDVPTLVIAGERESAFAREASLELARRIPGATLAWSPCASHLHPLSRPEWFAATVRDWLAARA